MLIHQVGRELGSPINGSATAVAPVLAHLKADGIFVSWTIKIGMPPCYVCWQVLHGHVLVEGIVPRQAHQLTSYQGK